jgi:hypothetical protein
MWTLWVVTHGRDKCVSDKMFLNFSVSTDIEAKTESCSLNFTVLLKNLFITFSVYFIFKFIVFVSFFIDLTFSINTFEMSTFKKAR